MRPTVTSVNVFFYWVLLIPGLLAVLTLIQHSPTSWPLHWLFPLLGTLFLLDLPVAPSLASFKSLFLSEASLRPTFKNCNSTLCSQTARWSLMLALCPRSAGPPHPVGAADP